MLKLYQAGAKVPSLVALSPLFNLRHLSSGSSFGSVSALPDLEALSLGSLLSLALDFIRRICILPAFEFGF